MDAMVKGSPDDAALQEAPHPERLRSGLDLLLEAYHYAHDADRSAWDFALGLGPLRAAGLGHSGLRVDGRLVKHFRVPSPNQERVLSAFQEEGWPPRIDDRLPPDRDHDPKRRLRDTIKSLNRHQVHPLLRITGDGTGQGIRWHRTPPAFDESLGGQTG